MKILCGQKLRPDHAHHYNSVWGEHWLLIVVGAMYTMVAVGVMDGNLELCVN